MFASKIPSFYKLIAIFSILAAGFGPAQPAAARAAGVEMPEPAALFASAADGLPTDQIIIAYKDDSTGAAVQPAGEGQRSRLSQAAGAELAYGRAIAGRAHVMRLPGRLPLARVQAIAARLAALPEVAYAEPDAIMTPALVPNDPLFASQWDFTAPAAGTYGINMPAAWDLSTGDPGVVVAVVDTGILNHADLSGRTVPGYDFIWETQTANDGDGRDNDSSDPGNWITAAEAASGFFAGCIVGNSTWHGTHVAGTIGANGNNNQGVAGINWSSKILPVRVLGKCGGYTSDVIDGVRWAAGLAVTGVPANPNPARVINLSLGGSGACGTSWQSAIDAVTAAGTTVVVAAGNNNTNAANYNPASCNNVITVAATDRNGSRSYFSNYGSVVEISAPGGDMRGSVNNGIYSTLNDGATTPGSDIYAFYQGTSMAAPHVTGVVSLLYSVNPALTPSQVLNILQSNVTAFPGGSTCNTSLCGSGILNAGLAVMQVYRPGAFDKISPLNGAAGVSSQPVLSWNPSSGATSYDYCYDTTNNGQCDGSWGNTTSTSITPTLAGNTTYYWQVRARKNNVTTDASGGWWSFTTVPCYALAVNVSPVGSGSAAASPNPNCLGGPFYRSGTSVSLTANPANGYVFGSWSGSLAGSLNPQSLVMDGIKNVTANFSPAPAPVITSFTPVSGLVGAAVTITGLNFLGATNAQFNGVSAVFTVVSSTTITTSVPAGAITGPISVTTPGGTGASAANFTVLEPLALLYAKPAATGSGSCASWANACTLQTALATAASGAEIWVMEGAHTPGAAGNRSGTFHLKSGVKVYGGFAGSETAREQRSFTTHVTILSGDLNGNDNTNVTSDEPTRAENSYHVVTGSGTNATAVLDGFTISGGNAETGQGCPGTGCGGGMENDNGSPSLANLIFTRNSAYIAGGAMSNTSGSGPSLENFTFDNNTAKAGAGGAIFNHSGSLALTNGAFNNNRSGYQGGAIYNHASSPVITNAAFTNNSAINPNTGYSEGGAIRNYFGSSPTLTNVTFTGNSVGNSGYGNVMYSSDLGNPTLTNVTINNTGSQTFTLVNNYGAYLTIRNSILWDGIDLSYRLIGGSTINDSVVNFGCPVGVTCTNVISENPRLGAPGSYGGVTQTMPLLPGSPAIDAGNAGACQALDQRGMSRVGTCDMGAFESQGFTLAILGGNNQAAFLNNAFAAPLQVGVTANDAGEPVNGGVVTFTAPSSGASVFDPVQDITIAGGSASASQAANGVAGSYQVSASAAGAAPIDFNLTNVSIPPPTVQFSSSSYSVGEDGGSATITVTLSHSYPEPVAVQYATSNGTATAGSDYTAASSTLNISAGQVSGTFTIPITEDGLDEPDETIALALSSPTNATLGEPTTATLTITDNDELPTVQFSAGSYNVNENGGSATITVNLSSTYPEPVAVQYATSDGTATAGSDYTAASGTLTIPEGQTSGAITVPITNDGLDEPDETIALALSGPVNANMGAPTTATLTIVDNDTLPTVQFSDSIYSEIEHGGPAIITVTLGSAYPESVSVQYATSNGTATEGSDYTAASGTLTIPAGQTSGTFTVPITDDGLDEPDETISLALSAPTNATLGAPAAATLTITDNDGLPRVQFLFRSFLVNENEGSATVSVILTSPYPETVAVQYATSNGTATAGSDYTAASGTLTFAAGQTIRTFTVPITNDGLDEPDETVSLALSSPVNATLGGFNTATLFLYDNDELPAVQFSVNNYTVKEEDGSATITVTLNSTYPQTVSAQYATSDGTATAGSDYTAASGTLTFNPGVTTQTFTIAILKDDLAEVDETIMIALSNPSNAVLGSRHIATLTILANEGNIHLHFPVVMK